MHDVVNHLLCDSLNRTQFLLVFESFAFSSKSQYVEIIRYGNFVKAESSRFFEIKKKNLKAH